MVEWISIHCWPHKTYNWIFSLNLLSAYICCSLKTVPESIFGGTFLGEKTRAAYWLGKENSNGKTLGGVKVTVSPWERRCSEHSGVKLRSISTDVIWFQDNHTRQLLLCLFYLSSPKTICAIKQWTHTQSPAGVPFSMCVRVFASRLLKRGKWCCGVWSWEPVQIRADECLHAWPLNGLCH